MKEKYFSSQLFKFKNSGTDQTAASIEMSLPRCSKSPSLSQLPTDSCGRPSHRGDLPVSLCGLLFFNSDSKCLCASGLYLQPLLFSLLLEKRYHFSLFQLSPNGSQIPSTPFQTFCLSFRLKKVRVYFKYSMNSCNSTSAN